MNPIQVGVVMGSSSDWDTMQHAVQILQDFGIAYEARVVSAHRMPDDMFAYAESRRRPRPASHHRRRWRRGAPAGHAGGQDGGAGAGRAGGKQTPVAVWIRCTASCRCPRACRWPPLPSAQRARPTRRCLRWRCWRTTTPPCAQKLARVSRRADRGRAQHDAPRTERARHPFCPAACLTSGQPVTLGVMGGGQLGRMFVQAAQAMGYFTAVLDPDPASPAGSDQPLPHPHAYDDGRVWPQLAAALRGHHHRIRKRARARLAHAGRAPPRGARCRLRGGGAGPLQEKAHFVQCAPISGVSPAPYAVIETRRAAGAGASRSAARHPENRAPGLRRQRPGAGEDPRGTGRRLGPAGRRALRAGKTAAAAEPSVR